jgi:hypothetical protein
MGALYGDFGVKRARAGLLPHTYFKEVLKPKNKIKTTSLNGKWKVL